jgi:hypothetical protein
MFNETPTVDGGEVEGKSLIKLRPTRAKSTLTKSQKLSQMLAVIKIFDMIDVDSSRDLGLEELTTFLKICGPLVPAADAEDLLRKAGGGKNLSAPKLTKWFQKQGVLQLSFLGFLFVPRGVASFYSADVTSALYLPGDPLSASGNARKNRRMEGTTGGPQPPFLILHC